MHFHALCVPAKLEIAVSSTHLPASRIVLFCFELTPSDKNRSLFKSNQNAKL